MVDPKFQAFSCAFFNNHMNSFFRDLVMWQRSMELATEVYRISKLLPKDERFAHVDQLRRCAISIPGNLAEGQRPLTTGEFRHHLGIARGSTLELKNATRPKRTLTIPHRTTQVTHALALLDETKRMRHALIAKL